CDVDLVQELSGNPSTPKPKRDLRSMFPTFSRIYKEGRSTVRWWRLYKRQTGTWLWASMAIHFMNRVVILIGGGFLIWWAAEHHLSRWQIFGIVLMLLLPYSFLENWAEDAPRLVETEEKGSSGSRPNSDRVRVANPF